MITIDSSSIQLGLDTDAPLQGVSRKPDEAGSASGFAEVFAGLHPPAPAPATDPDPLVSPVALQRVELSPAMQLIMPSTPAPDLASLQAFARSQGLDEQAIQLLLGDTQLHATAPGKATPAGAVDDPASAAAAAPPAALALAGATLLGWPVLAAAPASAPAGETPPVGMPLAGVWPPGVLRAAQALRPATSTPEAASPGKTAWAQPVEVISLDLMPADAPAETDSQSPPAMPDGLDAGQVALPRSWLVPRDAAAALGEGGPNASGLAVVGRAAGAPAILAGDLARLDPAVRTASETAVSQAADALDPGAALQALQPEPPSASEGAASADRSFALQHAANTPARDQAPAGATSPAGLGRDAAENLAQKMGEAIAQRLMSRLEQGNWQFRFVLHPRIMGEVQVNLQMHGGGLEGSFVSSHAGTRDLLNDGLQRLRDTLSATGMNVASLDVGAGHSSRQGQQSMATAVPPGSSGSRGQTTAAQEGPAPVRHRESRGGEQGWDVLV